MTGSAAGTLRDAVVADLRDETADLMAVLSGLPSNGWDAATPSAGWSVRDQVTHLAFFDDATRLALEEPEAFVSQRGDLLAHGYAFPDVVAERHRALPEQACLDWFDRSRSRLLAALLAAEPGTRLPWYGPDMGLASAVTARLMETWAHGQDVVDAVGLVRPPTARLRSIADLGVRTRAFAFALHGRPAPTWPVRVELTGPDGQRWEWGPDGAQDRVRGPALDFCLLVTQRRHLDDTDLTVDGDGATQWLAIAQAFAGGVGTGRDAGLFAAAVPGESP